MQSLGAELAPLAGYVEVVDPPELRAELARLGAQLRAVYGPGTVSS